MARQAKALAQDVREPIESAATARPALSHSQDRPFVLLSGVMRLAQSTPAGTPNVNMAPLPPQPPAGVPLRTLLYVEDNPVNLELVEQLIARRPDIHLLSAKDGISGIEMARASRPDIILMDINLPGISGMDMLKILAKDQSTGHIPVIALSANALPSEVEVALHAGFFSYLTKPIKVSELMDALDLALKFAKNARDSRG